MGSILFETVLSDFVSKLVMMQNIFPLLSKTLWLRINSSYIFKSEYNIIISRVISHHMGSMYIETPIYIYICIYIHKYIDIST